MLVDAMVFAVLSAMLISASSSGSGHVGIELLSLSTSLEDVAAVSSLWPDAVLSACGDGRHFPGELQSLLRPAFEQFGKTRFELACPDGSRVVLYDPVFAGDGRVSLSSSRIIVSEDGNRIMVVHFVASG